MALALCIVIMVFFVSSCKSQSSTATPDPTTMYEGATLVQERCTVCHTLSRVERVKYTASEWQTIVDNMIQKGAQLTPDEKTIVEKYLIATYGN